MVPSNSKHLIMSFIVKALALGIHITSFIPAERLSVLVYYPHLEYFWMFIFGNM